MHFWTTHLCCRFRRLVKPRRVEHLVSGSESVLWVYVKCSLNCFYAIGSNTLPILIVHFTLRGLHPCKHALAHFHLRLCMILIHFFPHQWAGIFLRDEKV